MYVYKRTEFSPYCLYTVGYYEPDGKWMPESDHEKESDAADRVTLLNGEPHVAIPLHRDYDLSQPHAELSFSPSTPAGEEGSVNYQHKDAVRDMLYKFAGNWVEKDSPELLESMVDYCMSLRPYPTKPSPQSEQAACPNCKETIEICACLRNKCGRCGEPVGNITFTVCDECWVKEFPHPSPEQAGEKLVAAQQEYIEFLGNECSALTQFAGVHGYKIPKETFDKGEAHRNKIAHYKMLVDTSPALWQAASQEKGVREAVAFAEWKDSRYATININGTNKYYLLKDEKENKVPTPTLSIRELYRLFKSAPDTVQGQEELWEEFKKEMGGGAAWAWLKSKYQLTKNS